MTRFFYKIYVLVLINDLHFVSVLELIVKNNFEHLKGFDMTFCKSVCPWAVRQSKQWSTWRGLAITAGAVITVINPVLGATVLKIVGLVVGGIDVIKNDGQSVGEIK